MRSQVLLRRSRIVLKPRGIISQSVLANCSRRALHSTPTLRHRSVGCPTRNLSSAADINVPPPSETDSPEEAEKSKQKSRTRRTQDKVENAALPPDLDIFWQREDMRVPLTSTLPPHELLLEALNNLLITLHPQTQHRATYSAHDGPPTEPTLALYCPIEGGDYVVDETVRELARRTQAEVIVLDGIEIAAGEWGAFGKAATAIQLPDNPLHFSPATPSYTPLSSSSSSEPTEQEEDNLEESGGTHIIVSASQPFPFPQLGVPITRSSRSSLLLSRRTTMSKTKAFFDDILNFSPSPTKENAKDVMPPSFLPPRIIYIRDYPTLAPSLSTWFPSLVSSVRAYRQGPIARPTSPVTSPVTIVLGMTPPIVPPVSSPSSSGSGNPTGLLRFLMNRGPSLTARRSDATKPPDAWDESEPAEKARERRLKERLRSWESGDSSFREHLPDFSPPTSDGSGESNGPGTGLIIAGPGVPQLGAGIVAARQSDVRNGEEDRSYFRLSVVVPKVRSSAHEKECRMARRRQINELVVRMAVGSVGGVLSERFEPPIETCTVKEPSEVQPPSSQSKDDVPESAHSDVKPADAAAKEDSKGSGDNEVTPSMWSEWGQRVEGWKTAKEIADRAVGGVVGSQVDSVSRKIIVNGASLEPTPIPWSTIEEAWISRRDARRTRRAWVEESGRAVDEDNRPGTAETAKDVQIDEVIERVKRDPDLDHHEGRLLGCIVDAASMSTTFNQVHLPAHTIDSVRTLVSLPLLHPQAFTQGVLKQHAMTGALLFGPPGTGKTLVVSALAKESGARMLIIKPSDVMDMYVGEGEKLVRSVFALARRLSPCIVFLDELDALFGSRISARETSGGATAHRGVITEFMQEMDGLKSSRDSNVMVIGATNRPFDLDDAVLRRLPRRLLVDLPGEKEREEILKILLRDESLAPEVDLKSLAKRTETFSGSDLKHLCVSAALDAVKEKVTLPWNVPHAKPTNQDTSQEASPTPVHNTPPTASFGAETSSDPSCPPVTRILSLRNFNKALGEISPSASESLGSLSELRRWNEEFGEGGKYRKRRMWGGRFGFTNKVPEHVEGRVGSTSPFT